ncbi:thermonuclease family protein [Sinorhizobium arboris]|uniref:thermonuclease family protein n=1 Tax=Sinorhizobium arboris TaxID=76745 RepID=UPI000487116F|nr:thermonuclease family protein [Sinorhizobium arboris]
MTVTRSAANLSGRRAPWRSAGLASASARSIGAALAALVVTHTADAADPLIGQALVIDGDTIEIAGERVQLNSVDAPEEWQVCLDERGADYRCGKESASALKAFLSESGPTRCEFVGRDRYGRFVGTCFRADGEDVNRWLIETGNAVDRDTDSTGLYASAQETAKSNGAGIWRAQPEHACAARAGNVNRKPSC